MAEKKQVSIALKVETIERLDEIAAKSDRSRSNLVARMIEAALRKGDYRD